MSTRIDPKFVEAVRDQVKSVGQNTDALISEVERLEGQVVQLEEVMHWAQAVLTALNVGHIRSESPLHTKLRQVLIDFRAGTLVPQEPPA